MLLWFVPRNCALKELDSASSIQLVFCFCHPRVVLYLAEILIGLVPTDIRHLHVLSTSTWHLGPINTLAVFHTFGPDRVKVNVGHIPIELSSMLCFFVKHGGSVSATLRQETYRASNVEQGGLEVPVTVFCSIRSEKGKIMERLKELLKKRWSDPRDKNDNTKIRKRKLPWWTGPQKSYHDLKEIDTTYNSCLYVTWCAVYFICFS